MRARRLFWSKLTPAKGLPTMPWNALLSSTYHCPCAFCTYTLLPCTISARWVFWFIVRLSCSWSGSASSPLPLSESEYVVGIGVELAGVAVAVGVPVTAVAVGIWTVAVALLDCTLLVDWISTCADLSCCIAFALFCSTCKGVNELPVPVVGPVIG